MRGGNWGARGVICPLQDAVRDRSRIPNGNSRSTGGVENLWGVRQGVLPPQRSARACGEPRSYSSIDQLDLGRDLGGGHPEGFLLGGEFKLAGSCCGFGKR